jgi:hypothetical protein
MYESLKNLANVTFGILFFVAIVVVLPILFIAGASKVSAVVWPLLELLSVVVFALVVIVLFPLSFVQVCRPFAAHSFLFASYIFGATAWVDGLLVTKGLWGTIAVVVGLVFAGLGIVPMGMLAALFNRAWPQLWDLLILTAVTYGFRFYAFRIAAKADSVAESKRAGNPAPEMAG